MNDEINERLDDLADLAIIWAERRRNDRPAPLIKELMIRACAAVYEATVPPPMYASNEAGLSKEGLVPRAWVKGQPYDD